MLTVYGSHPEKGILDENLSKKGEALEPILER